VEEHEDANFCIGESLQRRGQDNLFRVSHSISSPNVIKLNNRLDTQDAVAAGILPTGPDEDPTPYVGVREVPTFAQYNPSAYKAVKNAYVKYIKHIAAVEQGTQPLQQLNTNFAVADLTCDADGRPQLPNPIRNINGIETNVTQQQIIRSYLSKHYSECH